MHIVRVTYTSNADYVSQNEANINAVMTDLRALGSKGIHYTVCLCPDTKTFIHTAYFRSEEDRRVLNDLASFKSFQEQLNASGPEVPPKQEILTLVGTSTELFHS